MIVATMTGASRLPLILPKSEARNTGDNQAKSTRAQKTHDVIVYQFARLAIAFSTVYDTFRVVA